MSPQLQKLEDTRRAQRIYKHQRQEVYIVLKAIDRVIANLLGIESEAWMLEHGKEKDKEEKNNSQAETKTAAQRAWDETAEGDTDADCRTED